MRTHPCLGVRGEPGIYLFLQKAKTKFGALVPVILETVFPSESWTFLCQWKGGVAYICFDKGLQTLIKCPNLYYLLTMGFRNTA